MRIASLLSVLSLVSIAAHANAQQLDTAALDRAMGRAGAAQPGNVYKFGIPRSDMAVTVNGTRVRPALALGSWVAFKPTRSGQTMAMGDLVLSEAELQPVMARLQAGGVEQTAVHNHLAGETPRVVYMHIMAMGDAVHIAQAVHDALALTKTPAPAPASASPAPLALDTVTIARTLGVTGKGNGGVYQISVPRPETIREHGEEIPPSMGVATAINIQPTTSGRAVATGDFVLLPAEVNPVMRALRANGIAVTALHSHLLMDEPHVLFMHFWGDADVASLATGLRAALDQTAMRK